MSVGDEFWAIIAASYTVGEYTDLVDRCWAWIRVMA